MIYRCKHLKQLDFKKVKQKEREAAAAKYASGEAAADGTAATFEPDEELQQAEASRQQVGLALQQQPLWPGGWKKQSKPNRQRIAVSGRARCHRGCCLKGQLPVGGLNPHAAGSCSIA